MVQVSGCGCCSEISPEQRQDRANKRRQRSPTSDGEMQEAHAKEFGGGASCQEEVRAKVV